MIEEYRLSKGLMYTLAVMSVALGITPWFVVPIIAGSTGMLVFFISWTLCWILIAVFGVMEYMNWRLRITQREIEMTSTFSRSTFLTSQLKGYRQLKHGIVLEPNEEGLRPLKIALYTNKNSALQTWIEATFQNLDKAEEECERQSILVDERLGETEQQRLARVKRYKLLAQLLAAGSFASLVGIFFHSDIAAIAILLPFLCFWLIIRTHGRVMFEFKKGQGNESITMAVIISSAVVGLNAAMNTPDLVDWRPLIPYYLVGTALLIVPIIYIVNRFARLRKVIHWIVLLGVISAIPFGVGLSIYVNFRFNKPQLHSYFSLVSGKRISEGKRSASYYVEFLPVGQIKEAMEFDVSKSRYSDYKIGDTVRVLFGKGALGATWYVAY